jgi:predicted RNA-binding protein with PUA-like domain
MAEGEEVFVYHTGDEKAVVGVARVARAAYPDPALEDPRRLVIDLAAVRRLPRAVSLAAMRRRDRLRGFDLLRLPRLSVIPVTAAQWREIVAMAGPAE